MNPDRLVRRNARWVLALCVLAWIGAAMSPCCNLLADVAGHHPDVAHAQAGHGQDTPLPAGVCEYRSAPDYLSPPWDGLLSTLRQLQSWAWLGVVMLLLAAPAILPLPRPMYHGPPPGLPSCRLLSARLLI